MSASETTAAPVRTAGPQVIRFNSIHDVMQTAEYVFMAGNLPANCDTKYKVFLMLLAGAEMGFGVAQSMAWLTAPMNGKCSIWGDGGLFLIRRSGLLEKLDERHEGTGDDRKAVVTVKRRGFPEKSFEYTIALAKRLKSYQAASKIDPKTGQPKGGPWADDPDNMLLWRARWRAFRTEFTDVLGGASGAEEEQVEDAIVVTAGPTPPAALPAASPPTPPAIVDAQPTITDEQFAEVSRLRQLVKDTHNGDGFAEWKAFLQPFGVDSVKQLTPEQAVQFIHAVGRQYDPFTYPPVSSPAASTPGP